MSLQIKFSHNYPKLHGQTWATLLAVRVCKRSELTEKFIEYDTVYEGGHYPLPSGQYMVLVFLGNELIPFTTVRPFTEEKYACYLENLRSVFDITIVDRPEKKEKHA